MFDHNGPAILESFPKISPLKTLKVKDRVSFDLESEVFLPSSWYFSSSVQPRLLWSTKPFFKN